MANAKSPAKKPARVKGKSTEPKTDLLIVDPRQTKFLSLFLDPKSATYSNAKASAIEAGFSESYADNLLHLMPEWLSGTIGQTATKTLAQQHLDEVLQLPIRTPAMGAFGPIFTKEERMVEKTLKNGKKKKVKQIVKTPVLVINTSIIKQKNDMAKFALEAHDPAYAKKQGNKVSFNFNIAGAKERYGRVESPDHP